ncbi:MAG TPA: hypothetical protein VNA04_15870 [Thermoanaerobaculia bacterium]|nr:hypothetical protein [Thermoanaerobaculia bacterium]
MPISADNLALLTTPLSDREIGLLVQLTADPYDPKASNLFAYSGARTAAGLMTRLAAAEPEERAILVMAIRKAIDSAGDEEA